jgi:hypothetical protein
MTENRPRKGCRLLPESASKRGCNLKRVEFVMPQYRGGVGIGRVASTMRPISVNLRRRGGFFTLSPPARAGVRGTHFVPVTRCAQGRQRSGPLEIHQREASWSAAPRVASACDASRICFICASLLYSDCAPRRVSKLRYSSLRFKLISILTVFPGSNEISTVLS